VPENAMMWIYVAGQLGCFKLTSEYLFHQMEDNIKQAGNLQFAQFDVGCEMICTGHLLGVGVQLWIRHP
jgi:hypothetical protein